MIDPSTLYVTLPLILLFVVVGAFIFLLAAYVLGRIRPPTHEPIIGHYSFTLKGLGRTVEGIATTARSTVDGYHHLKDLGDSVEGLMELLGDLHLYAVRDGRRKVLVICDQNIESQDYSDSSRGSRFAFPHGWVSYRRVYGYGVEVSPKNHQDLFKYFKGEWDRAVFLYPENLNTGTQRLDGLQKAERVSEAILLLKEASRQIERVRALEGLKKVDDKIIDKFKRDVSEAHDARRLAERRALFRTPFVSEREEEERRKGLLPRMTRWRLLTLISAAALAYWYLPQHSRLLPNTSAVLGGVAMWLFWLAWDNWLRKMI